MKFSCTQENLHQGLSVVSHIANKNINLPILGNVLVKADDKVLRLMSTNLEIAIRYSIRSKIEEQGEFTVPSKLFTDYVSLLPKERVDILQKENSFGISCGTFQTKLNGIVASEFPLIPTLEVNNKFIVNVSQLRKAISQVLFAVAINESRPEISGVLFKFLPTPQGINLVFAATDSYRLAEKIVSVRSGNDFNLQEPLSVIVPSRTVAELLRILGVFRDSVETPEDMEIQIGDNQILFLYNDVELISRTIEGKYPDYQQLIPERFETEVIVMKDELLRAVKTASLFSRSGLNDVHLQFSPDKSIQLKAMNTQTGEHAVEIDGLVQGKENGIMVNFKYFLDGINNIETEKVNIQIVDNVSPCVVRPFFDNERKCDYLYIVMPIRQ